jgi:tRNA (guanine-N7-)-methyltransferase
MSKSGQLKISRTKTIPRPNAYIQAMYGEFSRWCFDEEAAPLQKGQWRELVHHADWAQPLDVEIGTGNGLHFANLCASRPQHCVLGIELKYKPMIQSIRRAVLAGSTNGRICRFNASLVPELFIENEINDVFIFFPDPWEKQRNHKHRLIQDDFLERLWSAQRPGSRVHFKTDSADYFAWSLERFNRSKYIVESWTGDLHRSPMVNTNFVTAFERIFLRQGISIGAARLLKI